MKKDMDIYLRAAKRLHDDPLNCLTPISDEMVNDGEFLAYYEIFHNKEKLVIGGAAVKTYTTPSDIEHRIVALCMAHAMRQTGDI